MTTYTKLKSGNWGIRSTSPLRDGQTVTVRKKSGETKSETIERVVWSGNGVWLAAIAQRGGRDSYGNRIGTGASYRAGVTAPGRRRCPNCGSRECSRAWDPRDLCDED